MLFALSTEWANAILVLLVVGAVVVYFHLTKERLP